MRKIILIIVSLFFGSLSAGDDQMTGFSVEAKVNHELFADRYMPMEINVKYNGNITYKVDTYRGSIFGLLPKNKILLSCPTGWNEHPRNNVEPVDVDGIVSLLEIQNGFQQKIRINLKDYFDKFTLGKHTINISLSLHVLSGDKQIGIPLSTFVTLNIVEDTPERLNAYITEVYNKLLVQRDSSQNEELYEEISQIDSISIFPILISALNEKSTKSNLMFRERIFQLAQKYKRNDLVLTYLYSSGCKEDVYFFEQWTKNKIDITMEGRKYLYNAKSTWARLFLLQFYASTISHDNEQKIVDGIKNTIDEQSELLRKLSEKK